MALVFDKGREHRLLIIPSLFDEANKMRRQLVEVMRRLDLSGIDSVLPDLPGWNESAQPLEQQTLDGWRAAIADALTHFCITHVLTVRAGILLAPDGTDGWQYAPIDGAKILRTMLRARSVAAAEAGRDEPLAALQEVGRTRGVELGGWPLSAEMFRALEEAKARPDLRLLGIDQNDVGGRGLWLRAEPDDDPEQADTVAAVISIGLMGL